MLTKNVTNIEVSCFKNYKTVDNPKRVKLYSWLTSSKYKKEVQVIRSTADKAEQKRLKSLLPAITPSGIFTERKSEKLVQHSGLICLDIDLQDNQNISNYCYLDKEIEKIENVAYCGLSVSGLGLFVLIPIAYPDKHEQHFKALQQDFASYGINIDEKCKDISRLRGYSYDDRAYLNFEALPYEKLYQKPEKQRIKKQVFKSQNTVNDLQKSVEMLIEKINLTGTDITKERNTWIALASAMASEFGETGRHYFHAISQNYPEYNMTENDKLFDYAKSRGYKASIGVFFKACKDHQILFKN
ncbi:MAG: BT4734/BF3469 family protein [Bacteroidota bacterium]